MISFRLSSIDIDFKRNAVRSIITKYNSNERTRSRSISERLRCNSPFRSKYSSIELSIRSILRPLSSLNYQISFLWVPGHVGIGDNELTDSLANATNRHQFSGLPICPYSYLIPLLRSAIFSYWNFNWSNLPVPYARSYRVLSSSVPRYPWFQSHRSRWILIVHGLQRVIQKSVFVRTV